MIAPRPLLALFPPSSDPDSCVPPSSTLRLKVRGIGGSTRHRQRRADARKGPSGRLCDNDGSVDA
jgi:hypothetical protein